MAVRVDAAVIQRIFARIEFGACWHWIGYTDDKGYGQVKVNGQAEWVHRIVYVIFNGPLHEGDEVHHTCHCASCVNPDHLERTTHVQNSREGAIYRWHGSSSCN